jgi:glutathione-specific gamma-glutamylcyclotransferase
MLATVERQWGGHQDLWVFGYASLIWRPEFDATEVRSALVHGWHRALRMRSRVNRGTPQVPGLVFALLQGGACRGLVYRIPRAQAKAELHRLWLREMPTGMYDPRWLAAHTAKGEVQALAFTLGRASEGRLPRQTDEELLHIFRHASGRYGTTLEYLAKTQLALQAQGIQDREVNRQMALARRHGLWPVDSTP